MGNGISIYNQNFFRSITVIVYGLGEVILLPIDGTFAIINLENGDRVSFQLVTYGTNRTVTFTGTVTHVSSTKVTIQTSPTVGSFYVIGPTINFQSA
jgi:hypothetical protein